MSPHQLLAALRSISLWRYSARDPPAAWFLQVSSCCAATVKLGSEQHRLAQLLSASGNAAEMAEAKCDALAAEVARHHRWLRKSRTQQENCHVSRPHWKRIDTSMLRER